MRQVKVEGQLSRANVPDLFLQADAYLGVSPGGLCKLLPLPSHRDLTVPEFIAPTHGVEQTAEDCVWYDIESTEG